MRWLFRRQRRIGEEHDEITRRLDTQEREFREMAKRVRILEAEVGIFKRPSLKEVNGQ